MQPSQAGKAADAVGERLERAAEADAEVLQGGELSQPPREVCH